VLFLDDISTGLDSSTTFSIVKFLADLTHFLSYTTVIALLQPAPETYGLFDDVLLLSGGAVCALHLYCPATVLWKVTFAAVMHSESLLVRLPRLWLQLYPASGLGLQQC